MNLDGRPFFQTCHIINQQKTLTINSSNQSRVAQLSELVVVRLSDPQG
jgi:hypothetical protein